MMDDLMVDASSASLVDDEMRNAAVAKAAAAAAASVSADKDGDAELSARGRLTNIGLQVWETARAASAANLKEAAETISSSAFVSFLIGVLLAAAYVACDPFELLSDFLDFKYFPCEPHECLLPVPDVNAWPSDPASQLLNSSLIFNTEIPGPESLAWDAQGRIYTGVADGRVIRWDEADSRWETFAVVSPYWSPGQCDFKHRGEEYARMEHVCGRPLGLKFDASGSLYVADAYFGLAVVGPEGGLAKILCNQSEGQVHLFTNDLDIDNEDGAVYFTVSSLRSQRRQCNRLVEEADQTGRVLKYELQTGKATVLLKDFKYPNGIALPADRSFLLIVSTTSNRIRRYWLKGPSAGDFEEFAQLPGYGDNIRATEDGRFFWVALHSRRTALHHVLSHNLYLARLVRVVRLVSKRLDKFLRGDVKPMVIKYNLDGEPVHVLEDRTGLSEARFLSTAQERLGTLWLSSVYLPYVFAYNLGS